MPTILKHKIEPYSAAQMYALVNDVRQYPAFLPWCRETRVEEESSQRMRAGIRMCKGPLDKWFTTNNILVPNQRIELHLIDGPFKKLYGDWQFKALSEQQCQIHFHLEFQFSVSVVSILIEPIFHSIAHTMVDAFSKRARQLYGSNLS